MFVDFPRQEYCRKKRIAKVKPLPPARLARANRSPAAPHAAAAIARLAAAPPPPPSLPPNDLMPTVDTPATIALNRIKQLITAKLLS